MMDKKGKEIDLGGIRVQLDPFILVRRVMLRQKKLLAVVAILGGIVTISTYLATPKTYTAKAEIAISTQTLREDYARRLVNRSMRSLNSDEEMMLIINELDLFSGTRASKPYEVALRRMRRELQVDRATSTIRVAFDSRNPIEAYKVVAFVTERALQKVANLLDSPFKRQLDALEQAIALLEPKVQAARDKLFRFNARHPKIFPRNTFGLPVDSPMANIESQIRRTETELKRCFAPGTKTPARPVANTPGCRKLRAKENELKGLLEDFTPNHPTVRAVQEAIDRQEAICERERGQGRRSGSKKGGAAQDCAFAVRARLKRLHDTKAKIEAEGIRKPRLQSAWASLSSEVNQLEGELRALKERRAQRHQDRLVGANDFQENFQLVDPPRVPELPSSPNRNRVAMVGAVIAAIIGIGISVIRESLRQSFLDPGEFEEQTGLPVLAVLPEIPEERV